MSRFFFETISKSRTYATGGSSNNEHWLTDPNHLALEMQVSSHHQECCCSYNMMKLARHLYAWSGDSQFIEYYERNLLNHRLGAIEPETGHTAYFLSLAPGAWKTTCTEDNTFWCCTGTAVEEFAKLNDTIYSHDDNSLFVNLYFASTVNWKDRGVRLRQTTNFPESCGTELSIEKAPAHEWSLHLRIPTWTTAANSVTINGKRLDAVGTPGSYLTLTRVWKAGDRVELTMPMRITAEPLADDRNQQAFLYGPLVLAGQFPKIGFEDGLEHNQGPEIQEAPSLEVPRSQIERRRSRLADSPNSRRSSCISRGRPGSRPSSQAIEPKLATIRRLLEGNLSHDTLQGVRGETIPESTRNRLSLSPGGISDCFEILLA